MKKSFAVIGLGRFGASVARTLNEMKCDVIAMDNNAEIVTKASKYLNQCVIADATKIDTLVELGIKNVDEAIVAIGENLQASIFTVINLKELGVPRITVKIESGEYEKVMKNLGATSVIIPEEDAGTEYGKQIALSNNISDYFELDDDYGIIMITLSKDIQPMRLRDLDSINKHKVLIVAIHRNNKVILPTANEVLQAGDDLYVIGRYNHTLKFEQSIRKGWN